MQQLEALKRTDVQFSARLRNICLDDIKTLAQPENTFTELNAPRVLLSRSMPSPSKGAGSLTSQGGAAATPLIEQIEKENKESWYPAILQAAILAAASCLVHPAEYAKGLLGNYKQASKERSHAKKILHDLYKKCTSTEALGIAYIGLIQSLNKHCEKLAEGHLKAALQIIIEQGLTCYESLIKKTQKKGKSPLNQKALLKEIARHETQRINDDLAARKLAAIPPPSIRASLHRLLDYNNEFLQEVQAKLLNKECLPNITIADLERAIDTITRLGYNLQTRMENILTALELVVTHYSHCQSEIMPDSQEQKIAQEIRGKIKHYREREKTPEHYERLVREMNNWCKQLQSEHSQEVKDLHRPLHRILEETIKPYFRQRDVLSGLAKTEVGGASTTGLFATGKSHYLEDITHTIKYHEAQETNEHKARELLKMVDRYLGIKDESAVGGKHQHEEVTTL